MKTYMTDIIPKLQRFSQKLDNQTLLINQRWVVMDEIGKSKTIYIFRPDQELLISQDGKVEKGRWEYISGDSLLIDMKNESYLFNNGFLDHYILALKVDGREEFAFLVNESKVSVKLNSIDEVLDFLNRTYINNPYNPEEPTFHTITRDTDKGPLVFRGTDVGSYPAVGNKAYQNGQPAKSGKYKLGFMWHIEIKDGIVENITYF